MVIRISNKYMIVEVKRGEKWVRIDFKDLKKGDIFRMFDPDTGEPHIDDKGRTQWEVISEPYITEKGIYAVNVKD